MCAKTTPEVPSVHETTPGSTMPFPTALACLIASASDYRRTRFETGAFRRLARDRAGHSGDSYARGRMARIEPQRATPSQ